MVKYGSGIPRDSSVDLALLEREGVTLKVGGYLLFCLGRAESDSAAEDGPLDEPSAFEFTAGLAVDELESTPGWEDRGSGRRIFPAVPFDPSDSAFIRAFARDIRNCLVASLGSAALSPQPCCNEIETNVNLPICPWTADTEPSDSSAAQVEQMDLPGRTCLSSWLQFSC